MYRKAVLGDTYPKKEIDRLNSERVKQIIESHGVIAVNYHESPVWIEQITDEQNAEVTTLDTNQRMEVPIDELTE
jgi:small acid-soluble spore protein H (minor)